MLDLWCAAAEPVMGVPADALRPDEDFANLMSMLQPKPTDKRAPSGDHSWRPLPGSMVPASILCCALLFC